MELVLGGRSPSPRPLCAEAAAAGTGGLILPTVPLGKAGGVHTEALMLRPWYTASRGGWLPRAMLRFADLDFQCGGTRAPPMEDPAGASRLLLALSGSVVVFPAGLAPGRVWEPGAVCPPLPEQVL